ncbi:hypothetical protein TI39_contig5831g00006 [Zymoseptoria brevis]|uniref:2EXR domain-containing protein n=1 Tax=Zymoseptoria brevis TaxID=1047168 RepID=A0A0F4G6M7_9PEZI|nr:hypothetical protein TI39_contig5831g00006 [Zymoseptoria brevis]
MDNCGFGKLSAELRNRIYDQVLPDDDEIEVYSANLSKPSEDYQPPITQVCREMRAETLPMFYGRNQFVLPLTTEDEHGTHWHVLLENSTDKAEKWLEYNTGALSLLKRSLIISAEFEGDVLTKKWYDHKRPWKRLKEVLRASGYSEEMYFLMIRADYWNLLDRNSDSLNRDERRETRIVNKAFREMGLRCEVEILGP